LPRTANGGQIPAQQRRASQGWFGTS